MNILPKTIGQQILGAIKMILKELILFRVNISINLSKFLTNFIQSFIQFWVAFIKEPKEFLPLEPKNLEGGLISWNRGEKFYNQDCRRHQNRGTGLLETKKLLNFLQKENKIILCDDTFKTAAKTWNQIYQIFAFISGRKVPVMLVYLYEETEEHYRLFICFIREKD